MNYLPLLLSGAVLSMPACSQYAVVKEVRPALATGTALASRLSPVARAMEHHPGQTLPALLQAASDAADAAASAPAGTAAIEDYNFAVARIFSCLHATGMDPWTQPLPVAGGWTLSARLAIEKQLPPRNFSFQPADQFKVGGSYVSSRTVRQGIGAPLVITSKVEDATVTDRFAMGKKAYYGGTAVARFRGKHCEITVEDPLETESVRFGGRHLPMAADFTAPLALVLDQENPKKMELRRLLNPQKYSSTARLARLQPYDPDKIPVLCVHGLMDSEATWVPLINTLRGDPDIRKRYQFWFFSYPSGYPYPYSAAILRSEMDAIRKAYPDHKKAVVIGHSMGGMISRLLLTDSGDRLWLDFFGKPPEATSLSPDARKVLEPALIFSHRQDVARVIFIAAPHRGADLAGNWVGRLGSKLVKAPSTLLSIGGEAMALLQPQPGVLQLKSVPNSVDTLASNNRFVKAVNTLPLTSDIPFHSIMGDRGKGDTPGSSDGLVPYWSSHLDGAVSEKIVPSGHSAQQNPEAIEEVKRILKLHAR